MSEPLDLLVIGAGACGLAGAISAHDAGGSVKVVTGPGEIPRYPPDPFLVPVRDISVPPESRTHQNAWSMI